MNNRINMPAWLQKNGVVNLALAINLTAICLCYLLYANLQYPLVGSDYSLAVPSIIDANLFFRHNGFAIQWYTPSFGGGLPAFPNPNNAQFSLFMLIGTFLDPWRAILASAFIFISIGFFACFHLLRNIIKLEWKISLLGAVFFSANGYMMVRLGIGHIGYLLYPILPVLFMALLDQTLPLWVASLIIAAITGIAIQGAGYAVLVIFGLSTVMVLPIIYLYQPSLLKWRLVIGAPVLGGMAGLIVSASKLSAILALMRNFPRLVTDSPPINPWLAVTGLCLQLLGTMNLLPLFWMARVPGLYLQNMMTGISGTGMNGYSFGYWEFDMSLSPAIFLTLLLSVAPGLRFFKKSLISSLKDRYKWVAAIFLILASLFCVQYVTAQGWMYAAVQHLPLVGSMHVNQRMASAFIFPIVLVAVLCLEKIMAKWSPRMRARLFVILNILAVMSLATYFVFSPDPLERTYNLTGPTEYYARLQTSAPPSVLSNGYTTDNTQAILTGISNLNPYEPLFGYFLENFHPLAVPGSVWNVSGGYYNMTDPSGYVFPEVNGNYPFSRIPVSEHNQLQAFVNYENPAWNIPIYQQILDWLSFFSSLAIAILCLHYLLRRLVKTTGIHPS